MLFRKFENRYVVRIGKPFLHLHVALADTSFRGFGGHLQSAVVSGTCEVVFEVLEGHLRRELKLPAHRAGLPGKERTRHDCAP